MELETHTLSEQSHPPGGAARRRGVALVRKGLYLITPDCILLYLLIFDCFLPWPGSIQLEKCPPHFGGYFSKEAPN